MVRDAFVFSGDNRLSEVLSHSRTKVRLADSDLLEKQVVLPIYPVCAREWLTKLLKDNQIPASWSFDYDSKDEIHVLRLLPVIAKEPAMQIKDVTKEGDVPVKPDAPAPPDKKPE